MANRRSVVQEPCTDSCWAGRKQSLLSGALCVVVAYWSFRPKKHREDQRDGEYVGEEGRYSTKVTRHCNLEDNGFDDAVHRHLLSDVISTGLIVGTLAQFLHRLLRCSPSVIFRSNGQFTLSWRVLRSWRRNSQTSCEVARAHRVA